MGGHFPARCAYTMATLWRPLRQWRCQLEAVVICHNPHKDPLQFTARQDRKYTALFKTSLHERCWSRNAFFSLHFEWYHHLILIYLNWDDGSGLKPIILVPDSVAYMKEGSFEKSLNKSYILLRESWHCAICVGTRLQSFDSRRTPGFFLRYQQGRTQTREGLPGRSPHK
jgi:hypothetical protein